MFPAAHLNHVPGPGYALPQQAASEQQQERTGDTRCTLEHFFVNGKHCHWGVAFAAAEGMTVLLEHPAAVLLTQHNQLQMLTLHDRWCPASSG
jgi:hypothetical protein